MALSLQNMAKTPKKLQGLAANGKSAASKETYQQVLPKNKVVANIIRKADIGLNSLIKAATLGLGGRGGVIDRTIANIFNVPQTEPFKPETTAEKALSIGGEIAGSAMPIGGIYKLAKPAVAKAITSTKLPARIAKAALPGSASVGVYEGAQSASEGKPISEVAKSALKGAAVGAVGEVAGKVLLKGVSKLAKIPKNTRAEKEAFGAGMDVGERLDNKPKQIPEFTTDTGSIRQRGAIGQRPALPMSKGEAAIKGQLNRPLLPGQVDNVFKSGGSTGQAGLPSVAGEKVMREYAERTGLAWPPTNETMTAIRERFKNSPEIIKRWQNVYSKGIPLVNEPTLPTAELNAARSILRQTKDLDRAAKILDTFPELRGEFMSLAKKITNRKPITMIKPKIELPKPPAELEAARNILKSAKNPDRIKKIFEVYPELRKEFPKLVKQAAKQPTTKPKASPASTAQGKTAESFREKINRTPEKKSKFKDFVENFRTQFVDDLAPLEKLEKGVRGKVASAESSLYKTARLFKGVPTKANEYVNSRLVPIIDSIEKSGYNYKDLGDYALAVHARDVNASGLKSGFTDDEINAVLQKFSTPEMEAARQQLVKTSTELLDDLAANGLINTDLPQILREKWPNYMPLFRHFDDDKIEFAGGLSKALANVTSPIKTLKGSERNVIDPIESMVKNIFKTINASDRNKVVQQLGKLADEDTLGQLVRRLAPGEERGRLNTVYERVNGKKVHYEVQPDVYKAIMDMDKESADFLIRMLQKPASILRAGATLTPEFSFRNPMRDVVQAYTVSASGFNPITDFPRALFNILKKDDIYKQWLRDSGGYGNIVSMDRNVHREILNKIIKEPASKKFVNVISGKSLIGVLRSIADVSESATKLGEYKAALRSGATRPEAAYRSRDIMDFARAGASVRQANRIVAFLNANIQGKSKLLRAIREDKAKVTVRALKAVTLPSVGAYVAQKYMANDVQRQTIQDAPTWLKDTFWLIPVPGTNQVARIPKPFDLAVVFANPVERAMDYAFNKDPKAFDDFASQTLSQLSIPVMLTGLAPFVEGMANYSFFRQGPIIPEREKDLNFPDQYDIRTSEVAKGIAKGVNTITGGEGAFKNFGSPRVIDNTIRGLTAGLGTYATSAIDTLLEETGAVDKPERPSKKISEKPLIRAFLVNENASGKSMSDLYDARDKLTRAKGSAQANKKPFPEAGKLKSIDAATKQIGEITKAIRTIENNKTMSAEDKRKRIDQLNERRNNIARKVVEKLNI